MTLAAAAHGGPIRVYFATTMYPSDADGFRGVFMRNVLAALARRQDLRIEAWTPPGELPAGVRQAASTAEHRWLGWLLDQGGISHVIRSGGLRGLLAPLTLLRLLRAGYRRAADVDLYHINWLQTALPLPRDRKPLLVTVLGNDLNLLRLPMMKPMLRRVFSGRRVAICPNAEWMVQPLRDAFGGVAEVVPVSFGIDPSWYAIQRSPPQPHRWITVSRLTRNKLGPLLDWGQPLFADGRRELHLYGPMEETLELPAWVHYHGPASPASLATDVFPNATGLITLSRHAEGRPQVMLEAMAASLPIIASRMPAHATVVAEGETGLLCDTPQEFAAALGELETGPRNPAFGDRARARARRELGTWDDCADRYLAVYAQLLGSARGD